MIAGPEDDIQNKGWEESIEQESEAWAGKLLNRPELILEGARSLAKA